MGVGRVNMKELGNRSRRGSERIGRVKLRGESKRIGLEETWGYSLT
jgi:hypothetical protein